MPSKRKPTYEQALGLQKGQATARAAAKCRAALVVEQTPEERAAWEERRKAAVAAYRARKASS